MKAFTSPKWPSLFGIGSLAFTVLSSVSLTAAFTAREAAWWTSIAWVVLFYFTGTVLAVRGIRFPVGIVPLIAAIVPLFFICLLLFARPTT